MDPITVSILITVSLHLALGIFQSVKSNHFHSECLDCLVIDNKYEGKDSPPEKILDNSINNVPRI